MIHCSRVTKNLDDRRHFIIMEIFICNNTMMIRITVKLYTSETISSWEGLFRFWLHFNLLFRIMKKMQLINDACYSYLFYIRDVFRKIFTNIINCISVSTNGYKSFLCIRIYQMHIKLRYRDKAKWLRLLKMTITPL